MIKFFINQEWMFHDTIYNYQNVYTTNIHSIKINVKELSENHVIIHCIYINDTNHVMYLKKLETTKGNNQMCLYFPCVHFFENF